MSQKNDRNSSDETFLRGLPIVFDVLVHDPSHFLNASAISYKWDFGDNTGLFVSNKHILNHTYVLNGTFNLNLTVEAAVSGPCPSPSPTVPTPGPSLSEYFLDKGVVVIIAVLVVFSKLFSNLVNWLETLGSATGLECKIL